MNENNFLNNNMDIQKHLYETGLQNIFNEYEKNIASVDETKRKEIEEAHYTRELSKKYLGEQASNNDFGDISGQVLDIYGQYQSNLGEINKNYNNLKLGFESDYRSKKNEYDLGLASTQLQIKNEEKMAEDKRLQEENTGRIVNAISTGNFPEGMNFKSYLESEKDNLPVSQYWALKTEYEMKNFEGNKNEIANNVNKYSSQEEWDVYVDEMVSSKKITLNDAEELKSFYDTQSHTDFSLNPNSNIDFSYFSNGDVKKNGKVYSSKGGETLVETNNVYDSSSSFFSKLEERANGKAFGTPFGLDGKWFVKDTKDGEEIFNELNLTASPDKMTYNYKITSDNKEYFEYLNGKLNTKSGFVKTDEGTISYKYDGNGYKPYIDFKAYNVKGAKGDFVINGAKYNIEKGYEDNGKKGIVNVKSNFKNGKMEKGSETAKDVVDSFVKNYFYGDNKKFEDYIKDKTSTDEAMVVLHNGSYYTITDGKLWELKNTNESN